MESEWIMVGVVGVAITLLVFWWLVQRYEATVAREAEEQVGELERRLRQMVRDIREAEEAFSQQLQELAEQRKAQEDQA